MGRKTEVLSELTDDLCYSVGSLTNATEIANTLQTVKGIRVDSGTIASYLTYLSESFLFCQAKRYDVKEKKYFPIRQNIIAAIFGGCRRCGSF